MIAAFVSAFALVSLSTEGASAAEGGDSISSPSSCSVAQESCGCGCGLSETKCSSGTCPINSEGCPKL